LHGSIASGAFSEDSPRWRAGGSKFLFPVRALSKMFRGKFLDGLEQLFDTVQLDHPAMATGQVRSQSDRTVIERRLLRKLSKKPWVVYSKAPFAGPRKLLDYLSRYTHRVAISSDRLVGWEEGQVTFRYRDRSDGDRRKRLELSADRFIGRFLCHVLPAGFMRNRQYGFLANRYRGTKLSAISADHDRNTTIDKKHIVSVLSVRACGARHDVSPRGSASPAVLCRCPWAELWPIGHEKLSETYRGLIQSPRQRSAALRGIVQLRFIDHRCATSR
jgi:hypothetical protein